MKIQTEQNCPICEIGNLHKKKVKSSFDCKGLKFTISNFPVLECDNCYETFIDESEMKSEMKFVEKEISESVK